MSVLAVSRPARRRAQIRQSLPTDHPGILDQIEALIDGLPDPLDLGPDQVVGSMTATARLRNRLDAYLVELAGTADAAHLARSLRAGSTGMLVATATGSNPAAGSGIVGTARALRTCRGVAAAFRDGRLSSLHVQALRDAAPRITGFDQIEAALVDLAGGVEPVELRRILTLLVGQCHPEATDADHAAQRAKRGISLSETLGGMYRIDGWLDALEGRRLREVLTALTDRSIPGDTRTPTQARADALADLVAAAAANTRPLGTCGLSVLVDIDTLPDGLGATLDDGQPIGQISLRPAHLRRGLRSHLRGQARRHVRAAGAGPGRTPGQPLAMGRPDRPRPRLHPLRTLPPILRSPPHHPLAPRRSDRPVKPGPDVLPMPPRPAPRPLHHHHR